MEPCPCKEEMGEFVCEDRSQCWEPCGELGKSEEHARVIESSHDLEFMAALSYGDHLKPFDNGTEDKQ